MKWEYTVIKWNRIHPPCDAMEKILDAVGASGWELVSVSERILYFKRPLKEKEGK